MEYTRLPIDNYFTDPPVQAVFFIVATPQFSPVDINLRFLQSLGWSVNTDRIRLHTTNSAIAEDHPLAEVIKSAEGHLFIQKLDKEEDYFVSIDIAMDGEIQLLSNDPGRASQYLSGAFLGTPPAFHDLDEVQIEYGWSEDPTMFAYFCGMLHGAYGWDPISDTPPFVEESLREARSSLEIANYKSCIVMCRRSVEALLKYAHKRLLTKEPIDNKGRVLTLSALVQAFRHKELIPEHLLHVADALRLVGNVPGAHAAEVPNYVFSRYDAEFALASTLHFVEQYFTKIDPNSTECWVLEVDTFGDVRDVEAKQTGGKD